jgi:hypothetical protein
MQSFRALTFKAVVAVALLAAHSTAARADIINVTLDTSTLSGTQTLAFGLTDGDAASNNTVMLSAFTFGGGSPTAGSVDCTLGGTLTGAGCSGDLGSGVTLADSDFVAFFTQQFTVGSALSFTLNTTNLFAGGTPDQFAMYVCDATMSLCYSDDASSSLLRLDLRGGILSPGSFEVNGSGDPRLDAPVVGATPVPEPATLLLTAIGLTAAGVRRRLGSPQRRASSSRT